MSTTHDATEPHAPDHVRDDEPLSRRATLVGVLLPPIVGLLIGTTFVAVFLAAFHAPTPHHLPVAVVAPRAVVDAVTSGSARSDDAFDIRTYDDEATARAAVQDHTVYGALVVGRSDATLLVAGANGAGVTATLEGALGAAAKAAGEDLKVTDVAPLSEGDSRGLSVFYGAFGVVLAGFLFGLTSRQTASRLRLPLVALSAVAFAVLAGVVTAVLVQPVFNALPAPFLLTASVVGLLALAIAATTIALLTVVGQAGTFVSAVLLLVIGNATSTGILPAEYLPGWLSWLAPVLPVGPAVRALRGGAYFGNDGLTQAILVLVAWIVGAALVVLGSSLAAARSRGRTPAHLA